MIHQAIRKCPVTHICLVLQIQCIRTPQRWSASEKLILHTNKEEAFDWWVPQVRSLWYPYDKYNPGSLWSRDNWYDKIGMNKYGMMISYIYLLKQKTFIFWHSKSLNPAIPHCDSALPFIRFIRYAPRRVDRKRSRLPDVNRSIGWPAIGSIGSSHQKKTMMDLPGGKVVTDISAATSQHFDWWKPKEWICTLTGYLTVRVNPRKSYCS